MRACGQACMCVERGFTDGRRLESGHGTASWLPGETSPRRVGRCLHVATPCLISARRGRVSVSQVPCPSQGCNTITLQRAGVTHAGHCFRGFNLLPTCPGEADIYLILIAVWPVSSRKHCMLRENICFQAAYAKLQLHKGNTYLMLTFTDF